MLGGLTAEIEDVIEGGAGLKGSFRHEEVLSGIKLYRVRHCESFSTGGNL